MELEALRPEVGRGLVACPLGCEHDFARGANHRLMRFDQQLDDLECLRNRIGVRNARKSPERRVAPRCRQAAGRMRSAMASTAIARVWNWNPGSGHDLDSYS